MLHTANDLEEPIFYQMQDIRCPKLLYRTSGTEFTKQWLSEGGREQDPAGKFIYGPVSNAGKQMLSVHDKLGDGPLAGVFR